MFSDNAQKPRVGLGDEADSTELDEFVARRMAAIAEKVHGGSQLYLAMVRPLESM